MFKVTVGDEVKEYKEGTTFFDIAREYQDRFENDILLVSVGSKLQELNKQIEEDCTVCFITAADTEGQKVYKRSATLLLLKAVKDVLGNDHPYNIKVLYSVSKGYYCTMDGFQVTQEFLDKVRAKMHELADKKLPIEKQTIDTDDAIQKFKQYGMYDKENLFRYRRVSKVNLYSIGNFEDYFYGYMVKDTSYIRYFDLFLYDEGFVLQLPDRKNPKEVPPFQPQKKLFEVQKESTQWGVMLDVDNVGALNDVITRGGINELILVQEALQEKKIAEIAESIASQKDKKLVMIAGPSSSGKTTFSHRLSIQLRAHGMKPHPIAVDDYFINRNMTPLDENGQHDFECLEAIDTKQFNEDMTRLLNGERVELPTYNFITGEREYKGNYKQLGKDDILVLEGIHCLNDKLSYSLPKASKFKIYISALTQLNVDEHNRISTTDGRLIRRMVRDARTRGTAAKDTIARWPSVRRGEENNIFPYQEDADVMFNSALIYELAVLKQYAEPILFGIDKDEPEYMEAKRLLKFLDYFVAVGSENIPNNSILREFVGGGCFKV